MSKQCEKIPENRDTAKSAVMYASFCTALDNYCDQIGIARRRSAAATILHDAAGNTITHMKHVTPADVGYMHRMERAIPHIFNDLMVHLVQSDYMHESDRMRDMCLADVMQTIRHHTR